MLEGGALKSLLFLLQTNLQTSDIPLDERDNTVRELKELLDRKQTNPFVHLFPHLAPSQKKK